MFYSRGFVLRRVFLVAFLFLLTTVFSACHLLQPQQQSSSPAAADQPNGNELLLPERENSGFQVLPAAAKIDLVKPLAVSTRPEDVALCEEINQKIERSEFANARWGVVAVSLKDGRVACDRDARKLFNPASIQKVLTAIVALDALGVDYRWKTSVYAQNQIAADGTLNGDLILYGRGAPDFDQGGLETLVDNLQAKGLKRVTGNVVGDESFFTGTTVGSGWTWEELQWYYGAQASALTFNENKASVHVENGVGKASTDYLQVAVATAPTATPEGETKKLSAGVVRGLENNNFYFWGSNKNWGASVAVHNPAGWAGKSLKEALEKRGIIVNGAPRSADWKSENKLDANAAVELVSVDSQTLGEIVKKMNKKSVNIYAELILRTIGKHAGNNAPDENEAMQPVRGDDAAGASVIKKWLRERHVATDEIQIHDGSGLSRLNFVSPEAFGRALIYAAQSGYAQVFTDSLPISGTDGTLGGRLGKVKGKVLAKTGTITFVSSLAGYAQTGADETFAFAVICNNQTRRNSPNAVIDAAVLTLAGNDSEGNDKDDANSNSSGGGVVLDQNSLSENKSHKEK